VERWRGVRPSCSVVDFPRKANNKQEFQVSIWLATCSSKFFRTGLKYPTPATKEDRNSLVEKQGTSCWTKRGTRLESAARSRAMRLLKSA